MSTKKPKNDPNLLKKISILENAQKKVEQIFTSNKKLIFLKQLHRG